MKFKIGDRVKVVNHSAGVGGWNVGDTGTLESYCSFSGRNDCWNIRKDNGEIAYNAECELELLSGNVELNMKEKFIQMFLKEPEKSFRKAGITNGDGLITSEGQTLFLTYLLGKNGDAFKTDVVDGLLAEEKDK